MNKYHTYLCDIYSEPKLKKGTKLLFLYEKDSDFVKRTRELEKNFYLTIFLRTTGFIPDRTELEIEKQTSIASGKNLSGVTKTLADEYNGDSKDFEGSSAIIFRNESDIEKLITNLSLKPV